MEFDWDEHNLAHIALHGITRNAVELAMTTDPVHLRDEFRNEEVRRSWLGLTADGRILLVIVTERHGRLRPVTSFYVRESLRSFYWAKKGMSAHGKT